MEIFIQVIGYLACVCMVCGYLPQAIVTIRTRDTEGIALSTFCMMGLGSIFFIVQGALLGNIPLLITTLITALCSLVIFVIKVHNDAKKRNNDR